MAITKTAGRKSVVPPKACGGDVFLGLLKSR